MIRHPRRSTLFPSTTLSRSSSAGTLRLPPASPPITSATAAKFTLSQSCGGKVLDRKSTRLNSSHLVISYAVFCLKKKNNANHLTHCATDHHGSTRRSTTLSS